MFPVIHGILAQAQEGESCVYPLDIKPELTNLFGYEAFNVHDECGHNLTCSGTGSHLAISQKATEALLGGGQIPEEQIFPPSYLGDGIYAVEFKLNFNLEQAAEGSQVTIDLGRLHIAEGEPSGYVSIVQGKIFSYNYTTVWAYPKNPGEEGFRLLEEDNTLAEATLGLYYNSTTKQFGVSTDFFGDHGYLGFFENEQACVLFLSSISPSSLPVGAGLHAEIRTKGQDLQLSYPAGTMGLDGEPSGG